MAEEAPVVNTTTAPVSGVVGEREVKDLPLNGRSFDNLITLNPGAINYSAMKSANTSTSNGNTFSVAGRRPGRILFLLNGIEYTGASQLADYARRRQRGIAGHRRHPRIQRADGYVLRRIRQTAGRAGERGDPVGNQRLHGTLFEFLRNSDLDARNFFDQGSVPPFRRNQFGGALGGPIKKDRLFLFGNYEGFRQSLAVSNVSVVPDSKARQGSLPNASGVYTPVAKLNQAMLPYMSLWPVANGAELLANGIPSGNALSLQQSQADIREDFGTLRTRLYPERSGHVFGGLHDRRWQQPDPAGRPAVRFAMRRCAARWPAWRRRMSFRRDMLNTFRAGFSRAAFRL